VPFSFFLITFRCFQYFQDRPSCCLAAPDEDENDLPPFPLYLFSMTGESEDEGKSPTFFIPFDIMSLEDKK
jgi:hypothetical protein